jgi:hypothetical protein
MVYSDYHQSLDRWEGPRISWINSEVQVVIIPSNTDSKVLGWIQDISPGGFKVKAEIPQNGKEFFAKWEEIHFETFEDFFQLKGQGRVMWASSNENMVGIRFSRLNEESRKSLYGFLGMLSIY